MAESNRKITDVDPLIETPPPAAPGMDYPAHVRTYNRFLNLVKWFIIHLAALVLALYFLIIAGQPVAGTILLLTAIGLLAYGLFRNPDVRHDVEDAVADGSHD